MTAALAVAQCALIEARWPYFIGAPREAILEHNRLLKFLLAQK